MASKLLIEKIIFKFSEVYPNRNLTENGIEVYTDMLADVDDEVLSNAAIKCLLESKFFPTIAELRAYIPEKLKTFEKKISHDLYWLERGQRDPDDQSGQQINVFRKVSKRIA